MALRLPRIQTLEMVVRCDGKKSSLKEKRGGNKEKGRACELYEPRICSVKFRSNSGKYLV